jgi:transposase
LSLQTHPIPPIPDLTARVARAAFRKGNVYMQMRDVLGTFFTNDQFIDLYPADGQPAYAPWRLALVSVMQFAENLTDRQAADAVRSRIDWKYALSLELTDEGFDFSVLSEFRQRLLEHEAGERLLNEDYPSWLYAINLDATTIWERLSICCAKKVFGRRAHRSKRWMIPENLSEFARPCQYPPDTGEAARQQRQAVLAAAYAQFRNVLCAGNRWLRQRRMRSGSTHPESAMMPRP